MIVVHHLENSRSQRILWLLEELGLKYEVKRYARDATTRWVRPPELKEVHPLRQVSGDQRRQADRRRVRRHRRLSDPPLRPPSPDAGRNTAPTSSLTFSGCTSPKAPWRFRCCLRFTSAASVTPAPPASAPHPERDRQPFRLSRTGADRPRLPRGQEPHRRRHPNLLFALEAADARGRLKDYPNLARYLAAMQAAPGLQAKRRRTRRGVRSQVLKPTFRRCLSRNAGSAFVISHPPRKGRVASRSERGEVTSTPSDAASRETAANATLGFRRASSSHAGASRHPPLSGEGVRLVLFL